MVRKLTKALRSCLDGECRLEKAAGIANSYVKNLSDALSDLDTADAEIERLRKENEQLKASIRIAGEFTKKVASATSHDELKRIKEEYRAAIAALKEG